MGPRGIRFCVWVSPLGQWERKRPTADQDMHWMGSLGFDEQKMIHIRRKIMVEVELRRSVSKAMRTLTDEATITTWQYGFPKETIPPATPRCGVTFGIHEGRLRVKPPAQTCLIVQQNASSMQRRPIWVSRSPSGSSLNLRRWLDWYQRWYYQSMPAKTRHGNNPLRKITRRCS